MLIDSRLIGIGLGWLCAFFVEKRYISRPAQLFVTLDAFYLMNGWNFVEKFWDTKDFWLAWDAWEPLPWLKLYLCIGIILGVIGLLSYIFKRSLSKIFYGPVYWCYSSKTAMPLSTAFVYFSINHPTLLYGDAFWGSCFGLACLSWFPIVTIVAVVILFVGGWLYNEYIK